MYGSKNKTVGFKIFLDHSERICDKITSDESNKKIILKRRNLLEREISQQLAEKTGEWIRFNEDREQRKLSLDIDRYFENAVRIKSEFAEIEDRLSHKGQNFFVMTF